LCTQRLLDYIRPDFVHIMQSGEIIKTGDMQLVDQLEASGYADIMSPSPL
jgi:Fe-S cluster assembly ATP-binding protein